MALSELLRRFTAVLTRFDEYGIKEKTALLSSLKTKALPAGMMLCQYHDALLYCRAYPVSPAFLRLVKSELQRIAAHMKKWNSNRNHHQNSGLPFTKTIATFSHDLLSWMAGRRDYLIGIESIDAEDARVNEVLQITLPDVEKHLTSAGFTHAELFEALQVKPNDQLRFLLTEFKKIDSGHTRDYLFDQLRILVRINPKNNFFSKAFNRLSYSESFFHHALLKQFDHKALLNTPLTGPAGLDAAQSIELATVIRHDLALLQRETDPATQMDARTLRLYHLERGISVAIYGMKPDRQLPLESYVGYTLFKNGYPVAYGGAWVFGRYALFGINIHDAYRGGESGFILCQLLRVYRHVFHLDYFEVEPYQFGKDNPEGIASGAYWFYHKYGFRSLDKTLVVLAEAEQNKMRNKPGYRTSQRTLKKFVDSNVALNLGKGIPPTMYSFTEKITRMIAQEYNGNRFLAEQDCKEKFRTRLDSGFIPEVEQQRAFTDTALLHQALHIRSKTKSTLLFEMMKMKSQDLYRYQELLQQFLK